MYLYFLPFVVEFITKLVFRYLRIDVTSRIARHKTNHWIMKKYKQWSIKWFKIVRSSLYYLREYIHRELTTARLEVVTVTKHQGLLFSKLAGRSFRFVFCWLEMWRGDNTVNILYYLTGFWSSGHHSNSWKTSSRTPPPPTVAYKHIRP